MFHAFLISVIKHNILLKMIPVLLSTLYIQYSTQLPKNKAFSRAFTAFYYNKSKWYAKMPDIPFFQSHSFIWIELIQLSISQTRIDEPLVGAHYLLLFILLCAAKQNKIHPFRLQSNLLLKKNI